MCRDHSLLCYTVISYSYSYAVSLTYLGIWCCKDVAKQYRFCRWMTWYDFSFNGRNFQLHLWLRTFSSRMSTAKLFNIPIHTRTLKSPIRLSNKAVPLGQMGFFAAVTRRGNCCISTLVNASFYRRTSKTRLSLGTMSGIQSCCWSYWELRTASTATTYADLQKSVALVRPIWK